MILVRLNIPLPVKIVSPGVVLFGLNGAALAAFGESPLAFCPELDTERDDGVKLGESTFNFFLTLLISLS